MTGNECEIVVDSEPNAQIILASAKGAVEETSKIYGPIFSRMVWEHALEFEVETLKEKPPESIEGLDGVIDYIVANLEKYPRGYCSLIYGIGKAESKLEGAMASGAKRAAYTAMKSLIATSGLLDNVIGSTDDLFEALKTFVEIEKAMQTASPLHLVREDSERVSMAVPECPYKDACRALASEGISRMFGGSECMMLIGLTAAAEIITEKTYDYKLDKFDNPDCTGKIYSV